MPRRARIFQRALCYHVMNRGINGSQVFGGDADYEEFSRLVCEYKAICGARVYHWAWMGNHYHMLLEVVFDNLRPFVGGVQQCYAQYHHRQHGSRGVFWQGRFKSKPVEIGSYLGSCGRYIERNPVRAEMVSEAWEYRWSSAAHYVQARLDGVTDTNRHLGTMGARERVTYAQRLQSGADDEVIWKAASRKVLGTEAFAGRLRTQRGRYRRVRGRPSRVCE